MTFDADLARFVARAEEAGSDVVTVAGLAAVGPAVRGLTGDRRTVLAPGTRVNSPLPALFTGAQGVERPPSPDRVGDMEVGIVWAPLGVAETGSTVLVEADLADRVVSLFARHLVRVLRAESIVASLDDALRYIAALGGPSYASLVTGPSRTADIERSLTIGVQGPVADTIVVVT